MNDKAHLNPLKIEHFVETDLNTKTGECSFHYNYLLYTFKHPLGVVTARSYLDEPNKVSILKTPTVDNLEKDLASVIQYLRTRYSKLQKIGGTGVYESV